MKKKDIESIKKGLNWLACHNKNLTKQQDYIIYDMLEILNRKNSYVERKEKARDIAIKWQNVASRGGWSMAYFVKWYDIFEKIGRKYGLIREFKENAIL